VQRDEILARLRERILEFAASRIGREAAEDVAQETLLLLHEKYPHVEAVEELVPLSFQIVRFKMAGALRKSVRRGEMTAIPVDDLPLPSTELDPERAAAMREMRGRLLAAVGRLGERCREIFRMKLEGRTFEEIRRHFGVDAINTIYTWDLRCRKKLLEEMGGNWEVKP
jgi:RNA polymerase sigma-70 factor (ECF subfamily)